MVLMNSMALSPWETDSSTASQSFVAFNGTQMFITFSKKKKKPDTVPNPEPDDPSTSCHVLM